MLNTRGYTTGYELQSRVCMLPDASVDVLAIQVFDSLMSLGYAHLGTLVEFYHTFLRGFSIDRVTPTVEALLVNI